MAAFKSSPEFVGRGPVHGGPWYRSDDGAQPADAAAEDHPSRYEADPDLTAAVNTALLLNKPLLVTGSPGIGKSDLAERVAWELQLGPVLRFEAQSLSEAGDLFYRFDLVGRMAAVREQSAVTAGLVKRWTMPVENQDASEAPSGLLPAFADETPWRADFVEFGPLGKAILRAGARPEGGDARQQAEFERLRTLAQARGARWATSGGLRSVVLIDEIDKASRDFPNDLLNGIDRMEFRIRELDQMLLKAPPREQGLHPIVIITSNLERDLPGPFLRRCAFHHIQDLSPEQLARIVRLRVFHDDKTLGERELPRFYRELLQCYTAFRKTHGAQLAHAPGLGELLDVSRAIKYSQRVAPEASFAQGLQVLLDAVGVLAKQRDDVLLLQAFLKGWKAAV